MTPFTWRGFAAFAGAWVTCMVVGQMVLRIESFQWIAVWGYVSAQISTTAERIAVGQHR